MNDTARKKILLVEDEAIIAMAEAEAIKHLGYEVKTALSGEKAVDAIKTDPSIDLVLMDIDLGKGIDGTEAAKRILAVQNIPIVFLTSHSEREMVEKVRGITRYGYVIKNSGDFVLLSSIEMAFELFNAHVYVESKNEELTGTNRKLRESKETAERYLNIAAEIIISLDPRGNITLLNESGHRLLGYEAGELIGKNWFDTCLPEEIKREVLGVFGKLMNGEIDNMATYENQVIAKSGDKRTILWHNTLLNDKKEGIIGILSSGEDITGRKRAELEALEAKRDWEDSFDVINDMITIHDADFNILRANKAAESGLGRALSDILTIKCFKAYHGKNCPPEGCPSCMTLKTGVPTTTELFEPHLDKFVEIKALPRFDTNHNITGMVHVVRDITERKQAEEALQKSEERFRSYVEYSPDAVLVADERGNFIDVNTAASVISGYSKEKLLGMNLIDLIPPEDRELAREHFLRTMSTGRAYGEGHFIKKDGEKRWWSVDAVKLKDCQIIGFAKDITERKQAEEQLRFLSSITENISDAIIATDTNFAIIYINKVGEQFFGYTLDEIKGKTPGIFNAEPMAGQIQQEIYRTVASGKTYMGESLNRRKDGSTFHCEYKVMPLKDNNGLNYAYTAIHRDVTERRQAEEHIKSLLAEKELLLREVHHRIKNNMIILISLLYLQSRTLKVPAAVSSIEDAISRVQSMMVLYDKLYKSSDFRKIFTTEYLGALIDEIAGIFPGKESVAIEKHIDDFTLDAESLSPLGIILNELITNAMKHAFTGRDKGLISVTLSKKDTHAILTMEDNGTGIPESIDIATSSGFGLQLVGMLAEQLGGTIRLERGKGSKFILEFEVTNAKAQQ
ncbi:MAG: PAS domain S-box protein [Candidatus Eremiobacteraeota bacterium]|nr:PAS domain S-box protein [Candidatus Eremiobacteraeota bacterium]